MRRSGAEKFCDMGETLERDVRLESCEGAEGGDRGHHRQSGRRLGIDAEGHIYQVREAVHPSNLGVESRQWVIMISHSRLFTRYIIFISWFPVFGDRRVFGAV
jgi:hypothetical protein